MEKYDIFLQLTRQIIRLTSITNSTGFKVNFAPILTMIPISARGQGYDFLNGVKGDGSFGFQTPVAMPYQERRTTAP